MICKYKYKGVWYSEDEIKNLLGEEFFKNEKFKITEYEAVGGGISLYSPVRHMTIHDIFEDDVDAVVEAQNRIIHRMGELVYIGNISEDYVEELKKRMEKGVSAIPNNVTKKRDLYIPETLDVAMNKTYREIVSFLTLVEGLLEKGQQMPEQFSAMYTSLSKLKSRNNFNYFISTIYPESRNIMSDTQREDLDETDIQTIYDDIRDNIKTDMEKAQSKYVKFLTNFIEYRTGNKNEFKIISQNRFSYAIILEALSGYFDTTKTLSELKRKFKKIVNVDLEDKELTLKQRKIKAIYSKLKSIILYELGQNSLISEHRVKRHIKFEDENTLIFDSQFKRQVHNVDRDKISDIKDGFVFIKRRNVGKESIEDTYDFLERSLNTINQELEKRNIDKITLIDMIDIWTYNYNLMVLRDLMSLMTSQRYSYPKNMITSGRYGNLKIENRPAARNVSSYDIRGIFLNKLVTKFLTKEDVKEFKESDIAKEIYSDIEKTSINGKKEGIKKFVFNVLDFNDKKGLKELENPSSIKLLANQIKYFLDELDTIDYSEEDYLDDDGGVFDAKLQTQSEENKELNKITADNVVENSGNTIINTISEFVDESTDRTARPKSSSADGSMFYPYHLTSYVEKLHDFILDSSEFKGTKDVLSPISKFLLPELKDPNLKWNPIVKGNVKIGPLQLYRGHKYYSYPIMYRNERTNDWFLREFSSGFISNVAKFRTFDDQPIFDYYYPPISNKPNAKMVELTVQSGKEISQTINDIIETIENRPKHLEGLIKNYKANDTLLFRVLDEPDVNKPLTKEEKEAQALGVNPYVERVYRKLIDYSIESAQDFVLDNELHISSEIREAESKLRLFNKLDDTHEKILKEQLQKKGLIEKNIISKSSKFTFGSKDVLDDNTSRKFYNNSLNEFIEVYSLYYLNNYVSTFIVNQLTVGDPAFFKHENDYIKRLSIAFSPGNGLFVTDKKTPFGSKENFKMAVFKEFTKDGKNQMKKFFESMLDNPTEEDLKFHSEMFSDYDTADAQGFMLESRLYDISKGLGNSFAQGTAVKPVAYTKRQLDLLQNDEVISSFVPTAVKYASFVLTDKIINARNKEGELIYPKARKLVAWMKANGIDEVVFQSGVKVGSPNEKYLYHLNDIIEMKEGSEEWTSISDGLFNINEPDKKLSLMTMNNRDYRIQQNPNTSGEFNKKLRGASQLTYVINIASSSERLDKVDTIYNSLASIMDLQSEDLKENLEKESSEYLSKTLESKFRSPGNENYSQFLEAGVDINLPVFLQKATIQFSSFVSDEILSPRFEGAKFQLVTEGLFMNPQTGKPLAVKVDENGNAIYGEVVLPKKFRDKIPLNSFIGIDGFTVRIPTSGIHSTMPFKVVGYLDEDSDVFIGPDLMTPVQGSDFDADAVFVFRDITWKDIKNSLSKKGISNNKLEIYLNKKYKLTSTERVQDPIHSNNSFEDFNKNHIAPIISFLRDNTGMSVKKILKIEKELKLYYHKQIIVGTLKEIISEKSDHNIKEMFSPIYMELINGKTNSVYRYIADLRDIKDVDKLLSNLDLSRLEYKNAYFHRNFDGNMLTGIFANLFKAISYMDRAGIENERPSLRKRVKKGKDELNDLNKKGLFKFAKDNGIRDNMKTNSKSKVNDIRNEIRELMDMPLPEDVTTNQIIIDGKVYDQMQEHTTFLGKKYSIRMLMDIFINLAIDNVKEQGLPTINAAANTASIYVTSLSLGIPLESVVGIMLSPVLKKTTYYKKRNSLYQVKTELEELYENETNNDINEVFDSNPVEVTNELLEKQIKYGEKRLENLSKEEMLEQFAIIKLVENIKKPAEELNDISMKLSVIQDMKVNFRDIEALKNYFNNKIEYDEDLYDGTKKESIFLSELKTDQVKYKSTNFVMPELFSSAPHIYRAIVYQRMMYDYLSDTIHVYSQNEKYTQFLNSMQRNISEGFAEEDRKDYLRKEISHFLASSMEEVEDIRNFREIKHPKYSLILNPIDSWQLEFAKKVQDLQEKERLKEGEVANKFILGLQIKSFWPGRPFISLWGGNSMDVHYFHTMQSNFKKLDAKLQEEFVKYAIMYYGTKFGTANFVMAIPPELYVEYSIKFKNLARKLLGKGENFEVISDMMEIQLILNSSSKLFTLNKKAVKANNNMEIKLKSGDILYYDMEHGQDVQAQGFQVDRDKTEEDIPAEDVTHIEVEEETENEKNNRFKLTRNKYVSMPFYQKGKRYSKIYRGIEIDNELLENKDKNKYFYKYVGTVTGSKVYNFNISNIDRQTEETKEYSLERAFNPFLPIMGVSKEQLNKDKFVIENTVDYERVPNDVDLLLYDKNDPTRKNAKIFRKSVEKLEEGVKMTFRKIDDILYDPITPELEDTGSENKLDKADIENQKREGEENGITKKDCE